jgi:hypothetical protein
MPKDHPHHVGLYASRSPTCRPSDAKSAPHAGGACHWLGAGGISLAFSWRDVASSSQDEVRWQRRLFPDVARRQKTAKSTKKLLPP